MRPSLLVVVQRYGDIVGGAERLARMIAERLVPHLDTHVATTTARDYWEWDNAFPAGEERVDGVVVHRFPVERPRARDFKIRELVAYSPGHSFSDEEAFVDAQGPYVPEMLEFLLKRGGEFDHILFYTYLYYPTARGLPLVPERAILLPTAHDEPPIYLTVYKQLFHLPRALVFSTEEERDFVHRRFRNERVPYEITGLSVTAPPEASGERFRARHGLGEGPLLLYTGRLTVSKGCDELLHHFIRWREIDESHRATLVLAGSAEMPVPEREDVRHVGFLSEAEKFDAYAACDVFVTASRFESLSIVALEALASGKPFLCHADCEVLRSTARRSGGGLYYRTFPEFSESLELLLGDADLRRRLGASGRAYVARTYSWDRVIDKYLDLFAEVRARNA